MCQMLNPELFLLSSNPIAVKLLSAHSGGSGRWPAWVLIIKLNTKSSLLSLMVRAFFLLAELPYKVCQF